MAIRHVTLAAGTATQVSLNRDLREIGFMHKGNVPEPIYVRTDGNPAVLEANDTFTVLAGQHRFVPRLWSSGKPTVVSIICATAATVEVEFP